MSLAVKVLGSNRKVVWVKLIIARMSSLLTHIILLYRVTLSRIKSAKSAENMNKKNGMFRLFTTCQAFYHRTSNKTFGFDIPFMLFTLTQSCSASTQTERTH